MGPDFSVFDAELESLETSPTVDVVSIARSYANTSLDLVVIDAVLNELDADGTLLRTRSSFPPEAPRKSRRPQAVASEEIVLPEPVAREAGSIEVGSGEMPLKNASGAFTLEQAHAVRAKRSGHDDTLEPFDDELVDAGEVVQIKSGSQKPAKRDSLFASAQEEADAAFEELFGADTRTSSIRSHGEPETYSDDTETFDTSSLGFLENSLRDPDASMDEELDSAEFEIVVDDAAKTRSEAPEKRPSFLGRLFGRKED